MEDLPERPAAVTEVPSTTLVVPPTNSLANYVEDEDAEGEFDRSDRVNAMMVIVAKTGELSNIHTPGDFLINKDLVIGGLKNPLNVVAIAIKKRYQNDLDFEGGDMGDTVDKAIEVTNRGGMLGYRPFEDKKSTHFWKPILQVLFFIQKPPNLSPAANALFPFEIEGADYGRFGYTARTKTAYNGIAKPLIGAKQDHGSVRLSSYALSVKGETWQTKSWMQPSLKVTGPTSEEMLKFISTLK